MGLSSRKEKIIEAVVDSYINKCEPISSSEIREKHLPMLSSATIRNELAALEEMGYVTQPHTSSGRIPTAEAYRLYVEKLMPRRELSRSELKVVKRYFNRKVTELDDLLKNTAKVISEITNLTSVAYSQNVDDAIIENIKIVKITDTTALIIIVTDRGMLKDTTATVSANITEEYFDQAAKFVSGVFVGHKVSEASKPKRIIKEVKKEYEQVFNTVIKILKNHSHEEMVSDIVVGILAVGVESRVGLTYIIGEGIWGIGVRSRVVEQRGERSLGIVDIQVSKDLLCFGHMFGIALTTTIAVEARA